jgi:hypothetical protein
VPIHKNAGIAENAGLFDEASGVSDDGAKSEIAGNESESARDAYASRFLLPLTSMLVLTLTRYMPVRGSKIYVIPKGQPSPKMNLTGDNSKLC